MSSLYPVTHLDLDHLVDREDLIEEMHQQEFKPFRTDFWQQGRVHGEFPAISIVNSVINGSPRFYKQAANMEVPLHVDIGGQCAVNILLKGDNAPITFEDWGDIHYDCALIDIMQKHGVPAHPNERWLFRITIFDRSYEEMRNDLGHLIQD